MRVTGVGFVHAADRSQEHATGTCEAIMRFRYRFAWADNGRAVVLESSFVEPPTLTRVARP